MTTPKHALGVSKSDNRKIGRAAATYTAQASCHEACPLQGAGCYAEQGHVGIWTRKLNAAQQIHPLAAEVIAEHEAAEIDKMPGDRPLRLHVVGDCKTPKAAETLAAAAERYIERGGQPVWTYTHTPVDEVPLEHWGPISVLKSCETSAQVEAALDAGFAAALVLDEFPSVDVFTKDGLRVLPCLEQAGKAATCTDCRVCFNTKALNRTRTVIGFAAHGSRIAKVKSVLAERNAA